MYVKDDIRPGSFHMQITSTIPDAQMNKSGFSVKTINSYAN